MYCMSLAELFPESLRDSFFFVNERVAYTYMYIKLSFRKFVKVRAELEFERYCGGDIQGYHSVHIGKQIPRENKTLGKSW